MGSERSRVTNLSRPVPTLTAERARQLDATLRVATNENHLRAVRAAAPRSVDRRRPRGPAGKLVRLAAMGTGGAAAAVVGLLALVAVAYVISWVVVGVLVALGVGS